MAKFTAYQRRLFVLLSVANFFEGYDFLALSQILPNLKASVAQFLMLQQVVTAISYPASASAVSVRDEKSRRCP